MNNNNYSLFSSIDNEYEIRQYGNEEFGFYYLCVPNRVVDIYQLFIGLPKIDLMNTSYKNKDTEKEIRRIYDKLYSINPSAIYAIPNIDAKDIKEATNENDDRLYKSLYSKLHSMTFDIYRSFTLNQNNKINQVIHIVKQDNDDMKFINWIDTITNGLVSGIDLNNVRNEIISNINIISNNENNVVSNNVTLDNNSQINSNVKKKKKVNKVNPSGFSSISFLVLMITISILIGISVAYLIIK